MLCTQQQCVTSADVSTDSPFQRRCHSEQACNNEALQAPVPVTRSIRLWTALVDNFPFVSNEKSLDLVVAVD
jgi:hypothetical protein